MQNYQGNTPHQKSQPLVSFILTYYNLPVQMLCECIDSILSLSLSPDEREIIVIDDGSEVSPVNAIKQCDKDIIYIRQTNGGVSEARNTALRMASGKYIQIVDGDDYLLKNPYEHCLELIRTKHDIDVVLFDFTHSSDSATNYKDSPVTSGTEFLCNNNLKGAVWCILFRQSICGKLKFTPGIQYGEDEEFTPQLLLRAESVIETDAKAYFYRKRNTSATHQQDPESCQRRLDDTIAVIQHLHQITDTMPPADRIALQRRVAQLTMDYIYNIIVLTRSRETLNQRIDTLRQLGLFPLPDNDYSAKYLWFRRISATSIGRSFLLNTLPFLKKER